jgi:hypothetical protein
VDNVFRSFAADGAFAWLGLLKKKISDGGQDGLSADVFAGDSTFLAEATFPLTRM